MVTATCTPIGPLSWFRLKPSKSSCNCSNSCCNWFSNLDSIYAMFTAICDFAFTALSSNKALSSLALELLKCLDLMSSYVKGYGLSHRVIHLKIYFDWWSLSLVAIPTTWTYNNIWNSSMELLNLELVEKSS